MSNSRRDESETGRRGAKTSSRPVARSGSSFSTSTPLITLLTDFGTADYFVGAMKGVILSIQPQARIVDLTHDIPPQDVAAAAFNLLAVYQTFPAGTIHVAVVDPGVGSSRRPIVAVAGDQYFVGPDNGIFGYIFEREENLRVFHLTREEYFRHPVSNTFHGRDIFAPVAAHLSGGAPPETLGSKVDDHVCSPPLAPESSGSGGRRGRILHIDHFGNCITNFTRENLPTELNEGALCLMVGKKLIKSLRRCFADESERDHHDELFAIWGSAGFLEIAAESQSAAKMLNVRRGQLVTVSAAGKPNAKRTRARAAER